MTVRPATSKDAAALATLLRDLNLGRLEAEAFKTVLKQVANQLSAALADGSHSIYVSGETELLAYASVHWRPWLFKRRLEGYITELFVAE